MLQIIARTLYAIEQDSKTKKMPIRGQEAEAIRSNVVFVIRMLQDGTKSEDYKWLSELFRQQTLCLLLNPRSHGIEAKA